MLVLSRDIEETLQIGEEIEVVVFAIHGTQVRLGIKAPRDVVIIRPEIRKIKQKPEEME